MGGAGRVRVHGWVAGVVVRVHGWVAGVVRVHGWVAGVVREKARDCCWQAFWRLPILTMHLVLCTLQVLHAPLAAMPRLRDTTPGLAVKGIGERRE